MASRAPNAFADILGVGYEHAVLPVDPALAPVARDTLSGGAVPVQVAPALPSDLADDDPVGLAAVTLSAGAQLALERGNADAAPETSIRVTEEDDAIRIDNGDLALRVPRAVDAVAPLPGPFLQWRRGDGPWRGACRVVDVPVRARVETVIESLGPVCVQWRTTYRWGGHAGFTVRARWVSGADTVIVAESIPQDTPAAVEWTPLAPDVVSPLGGGGGERVGPMRELTAPGKPDADVAEGRRRIASLGHVAYWGQWQIPWAGGVAPADDFAGLFTGWGSLWEGRGRVRIDLFEDDLRGATFRLPIRRGRRVYGILFSDRAASRMETADDRCLLNRRRTMLADFAPAKVRHWRIDPPVNDRARPPVRLLAAEHREGFRERLAQDPAIPDALQTYLTVCRDADQAPEFAAAWWADDEDGLRSAAASIADWAARARAEIADGGYERLIIFDGRSAKHHAYSYDVLRAEGRLEPDVEAAIGRHLLALAYMFADDDFCCYDDFWTPLDDDPDELAHVMRDEMGDCPVPPNFACEFFSTTGVMAELFPEHPLAEAWRTWAIGKAERFLERFFEPDGAYLESVNYHTHAFNEMLCHFYALRANGRHDFFAHPRVRGSFAHIVAIQLPRLAEAVPGGGETVPANRHGHRSAVYAGGDGPRAPLPADGNSGGHGIEQEIRGDAGVGARLYREIDPSLSAALMHAWAAGGKRVLDDVHPLLTLVTLDPSLPAAPGPWASTHRKSLGVVSKATDGDGTPVYCLFRAGRATHHMCFDQGNLHLAWGEHVLLGDHGYHTADSDGNGLAAATTWLHSTLTYGPDRNLASGYTGLEEAPEPIRVHLGPDVDWVAHRIVNTQYRDFSRFSYTVQLPAPRTVHLRQYLFCKPDVFVIRDTFEDAAGPATFWLHPTRPVTEVGPQRWRAGEEPEPHLEWAFLQAETPTVVENRQVGPLWSFGAVAPAAGAPFVTVLVAGEGRRLLDANWNPDTQTVGIRLSGRALTVRLPEGGDAETLPDVRTEPASD